MERAVVLLIVLYGPLHLLQPFQEPAKKKMPLKMRKEIKSAALPYRESYRNCSKRFPYWRRVS